MMGPLYHLPSAADRLAALREARRVGGCRFSDICVLGIEAVGWMFTDFEARWADEALRRDMLTVARALEAEPSIVGASAHLLGIGRKS